MPLEMTELEKMIIGLLEGCRGEANALRRRNLVEILAQFEDRKVREAISHLQTEHGAKIISTTKGYYVPITPEEIMKAYEFYMSYALAMLVKAAKITDRPLKEVAGQLSLELEK